MNHRQFLNHLKPTTLALIAVELSEDYHKRGDPLVELLAIDARAALESNCGPQDADALIRHAKRVPVEVLFKIARLDEEEPVTPYREECTQ